MVSAPYLILKPVSSINCSFYELDRVHIPLRHAFLLPAGVIQLVWNISVRLPSFLSNSNTCSICIIIKEFVLDSQFLYTIFMLCRYVALVAMLIHKASKVFNNAFFNNDQFIFNGSSLNQYAHFKLSNNSVFKRFSRGWYDASVMGDKDRVCFFLLGIGFLLYADPTQR